MMRSKAAAVSTQPVSAEYLAALERDAAKWRSQAERRREKARARYQANPEKVIAQVSAYQERNKDKVTAKRRARYRAAAGHYIAKGREYAAKRKETGKAANYREAIRPQARQYSRERSAVVTEGYAREMLAKYSPLSAKDFPQTLVDLKQVEIKLKRAIK